MNHLSTHQDPSPLEYFTLENDNGIVVKITNYGAIITSIITPDRDGNLTDIALGHHTAEEYINAVDKPYLGAVVGRYGNRIANGKFTLDGITYTLATNNTPNHLHGGTAGFDKVIWKAKYTTHNNEPAIELSYFSKDGEEGYPGNLTATVIYSLSPDNTLSIFYQASTDKATPINLTNHSYFNLAGEGNGDILDHHVWLNADHYVAVDPTAIPTGEICSVTDSPFDFTASKPIGNDINTKHTQISNGLGYDHTFILNKSHEDGELTHASTVYDPNSGRVMEVHTTEPGVQFYSGNYLDGSLTGKSGNPYSYRGGLCLETQHYPDSPNQPSFPNTILQPGETYTSLTTFQFTTQH